MKRLFVLSPYISISYENVAPHPGLEQFDLNLFFLESYLLLFAPKEFLDILLMTEDDYSGI